MVITANCAKDHLVIKKACWDYHVPYTKASSKLYVVDCCTAIEQNIQKVLDDIGQITPVNLQMIKEGFK